MERLAERYEVSLVGHRGTMQDVVFKILAENVTIGRGEENDIVLADPSVSSEHARIVYDGIAFEISDLGSKTGLRVNSKPVTQAEIQDGDKIRIGNSIFIFSVKVKGGSAAAQEAPSLMAQGQQMDSGAKVRIIAYSVVSMFMLLGILLLLGQNGSGDDRKAAKVQVDIGALAVEQFTAPKHAVTDEQVKAAALHLQLGANALDSGNLLEAIDEFKESLKENPACETCQDQLKWAFDQLRNRISYHYVAGDDDNRNLRYNDALRHWNAVLKLVQPKDKISLELQERIKVAQERQAALSRRAAGLQ